MLEVSYSGPMDVTGRSALVFPLTLATTLPAIHIFTYLAFPWAEDGRVACTGADFSTSLSKVSAQEELKIGSFRLKVYETLKFPKQHKMH